MNPQFLSNMKARLIVLIVFSSLIYSCMPDPLTIENIPQHDEKLIVSSQLIPNHGFVISVSRSYDPLEFSIHWNTQEILNRILIDSAEVSVRFNEQSIKLKQIGQGVYSTNQLPLFENKTYKLEVKAEGFEQPAYAQSKMLPKVKIDSLQANWQIRENDTTLNLSYSIQDKKEANWYILNVYKNTSSLNNYYQFMKSHIKTVLINDQDISDAGLKDIIELPYKKLIHEDSLSVSLSNISQEYYEFLNLRSNSMNWIMDITQEPVNYPSNIENGLGIFNAHQTDLHQVPLRQKE